MKENKFLKIFFLILKILLPIGGLALIFFLVLMSSLKLLEDKKTESQIDEGKYILSKLADEYEKILLANKSDLDKERITLLALRNKATEEERRKIERQLRAIEKQRTNINTKYEENVKEKMEIEASLKSIQENLMSSGQEITKLNKKVLDLSVANESLKEYWGNYKAYIKDYLANAYRRNKDKLGKIDKGFVKNNGKEYIVNEIKGLFGTISTKNINIKEINNNLVKEKKKVSELERTLDRADEALAFQRKHSKTVNQFAKLVDSYRKGEGYYRQRRYEQANSEYNKVIDTFDEVKTSSEKIDQIYKIKINSQAFGLYKKAKASINSKKYDSAFSQLSLVITEAPESDYTSKALSDLLKIGSSLSDRDKISIANKTASELYKKAETLKNKGSYDEAMGYYTQIITDYPYSDYVRPAFNGNEKIRQIFKDQQLEKYNKMVREKFAPNYERFVEANKIGDIENARVHYFEGLRNAFNTYSKNSINEFKEFEDKYIEKLLEVTRESFEDRYSLEFEL